MPEAVGVLIVEDHAMVAEGLQLAAETRTDVEIRGIASNLASAIELAGQLQPDVIVLDGQLPDGEGIAAVGRFHAAAPDAKVLVVSGFVSDRTLFRAIEAGVEGVMTKGRSLEEVLDAVTRVAEGESVFAPELLAKMVQRMGGSSSTRDRSALTARELDVLELLASGASTQAIGGTLHLSANTVRNHISAILLKLGAKTRLEAVAIGIRSRLVSPPLS